MLEVGRLRRERRAGGKTDALDAIRAARSVLASERQATPRAGSDRQALQALVAAREGAVDAKRAGLCQLRDLLIATPEPLRSELRPLTAARLLQRLASTRPAGRHDPELRGSLLALRSIARRVLQLTTAERQAAQLVLAWSHHGRIHSETAFARLAGAAPIPASSGQTIRYRLGKPAAASSATSPAASTGYSNTNRRWPLDRHRCITGPGEGAGLSRAGSGSGDGGAAGSEC